MKRFFALITALLLLSICGCENVSYDVSNDAPESIEDIYEKLDEELPTLDDGSEGEDAAPISQSFKIVTNDASVFSGSEQTAGIINAAVVERNEFLRQKYGASIQVFQKEEAAVADELKTAIESGNDYGDMLSLSAKKTVSLYLSGLLLDMNTLPSFNADSNYFDKNNAKKLATNSSLYLLADPINLVYGDTYAMFYNRELIENAGTEDPISLVKQGKWTWDKMLEISKAAAKDVFHKSGADIANDVFAYGAYYEEGTYPTVMWTSTGKSIIGNTYRAPVGMAMNGEEAETLARKLKTYFDTKGKYPFEGDDALKAFKSGRLVFFCNKLDYIYAFSDDNEDESKFSVLPIPKLDEAQKEYHCLVSNDARVISVPKTVEKTTDTHKRFVSVMISAMCATGGDTVCDAFVSAHISLYFSSNDEAVAFRTVCESITYDFSNVYGGSIKEIKNATTKAISDYIDFGSDVSNSIARAKDSFDKYCKTNFN